jgi:Zn-dependent protease with chaperone function
VSIFVAAAVLMMMAFALLGPVSTRLARSSWVTRAPRSAVVLWQSIGLSAIASGIGAGLAVAVSRYHAGFAPGMRELVIGLVGGHPLLGLGLPDALGLTLAADLLIVLFVVFGSLMARTIRSRARHRRLLNLLARESPQYPGTELIEDIRPVAYCLPGRRPRIVMSDGALQLLSSHEARAVIGHEQGHAQEHHGLVMLPMLGLQKLFAWVPYARLAPVEIASLLEMSTIRTTWRQRSSSWQRQDTCRAARSVRPARPFRFGSNAFSMHHATRRGRHWQQGSSPAPSSRRPSRSCSLPDRSARSSLR